MGYMRRVSIYGSDNMRRRRFRRVQRCTVYQVARESEKLDGLVGAYRYTDPLPVSLNRADAKGVIAESFEF